MDKDRKLCQAEMDLTHRLVPVRSVPFSVELSTASVCFPTRSILYEIQRTIAYTSKRHFNTSFVLSSC